MNKKSAIAFPALILLIWTLFFAGWGFDDLASFFAHPARVGLVIVGVVAVAAGVIVCRDVHPFRRGQNPVGRQPYLLALVVPIMLSVFWFLPYADRRSLLVFGDGEAWRYVGLLLHVAGSAIRFAGLRTLGKQFSAYVTLQENHQLVQTGIYTVVRHPMYLGGLLAFTGLALIFRSWLVLPLLALIGPFLGWRIRQEEKLLREQFGAEFDAYRQRSWRLLPYLY